MRPFFSSFFFFFNDTATTEIYTLSLHDALPISVPERRLGEVGQPRSNSFRYGAEGEEAPHISLCPIGDRKSTRLNSSHSQISYAVFCLKKKKNTNNIRHRARLDSVQSPIHDLQL